MDDRENSRPTKGANPRKIYIGNLPFDAQEYEVREKFSPFGKIILIEAKGKFAFVEFEEPDSATAAVTEMHGQRCLGGKISVQHHNPSAARGPPPHEVVLPGDGRPGNREVKTNYRVLVLHMDERASWQDLKDFGRNAGEVNFANIFSRDGENVGVLEFYDRRTMERALDKLDGMRLYNRRVRVQPDRGQESGGGASRRRSRSRSRDRRYSPERSPTRRRSIERAPPNGGPDSCADRRAPYSGGGGGGRSHDARMPLRREPSPRRHQECSPAFRGREPSPGRGRHGGDDGGRARSPPRGR